MSDDDSIEPTIIPEHITPEHLVVYEAVCEELRKYTWSAARIASRVAQWVQTRNPYYLYTAIVELSRENIPYTASIQEQVSILANIQLNGKLSGTAEKIIKEDLKSSALHLMANMIYEGLTVEEAAIKAHNYYEIVKKNHPNLSVKNLTQGTLAKYYQEEMRRTNIESDLFSSWKRNCPDHSEQWEPLINSLPDHLSD